MQNRGPYRAMFYSVVTVTLALLAITLWIMAIHPMLAETAPAVAAAGSQPGVSAAADHHLRQLFRGTLALALLLTCILVIIGFVASWREWMRPCRQPTGRSKTKYVDAWKLAGERMAPPADPEDTEDLDEETK